jgi:hypothetical protein
LRADRRPPQIGVDQQDAGIGFARQRARQVDRGERLAVAGAGTRDGNDLERPLLAQLLELEAKPLIALGGKRVRRRQRHESRGER